MARGEAKAIPAVRARTATMISLFPKLISYHHIIRIVKWLLALFEEHSCSATRTANTTQHSARELSLPE
jgi:hypothetical protein